MSRRSTTIGRPDPPRRFSSHLRQYQLSSRSTGYGTIESPIEPLSTRTNTELEHLLEDQHEDEEHADSDGLYPPNCCWTADEPRPVAADLFRHEQWPVYDNIHKIRHEVINSIDDPYSIDQLKAPRMNISVVRPLVDQFYATDDLSIIYCLLVNRTQFIRDQSTQAHHQTVNLTRALLCEIVAEKVLRRYNEHNPGPKGLLKLANILVAGFEPFQNAPKELIESNDNIMHYVRSRAGKLEKGMTALEVAILSESKSFLASSACQKVVDAIYRGKIVYTPNSFIDVLPDYWKRRPISLYDPRHGPILNQYRMTVPRTRNVIEIVQFTVLLVLYLFVMEQRISRAHIRYTILEFAFDLYAWGWVLDQICSMLEHGWTVYTQNLWSFLDVIFCSLFACYFGIRMYALGTVGDEDSQQWARLSLDVLSCAAPIVIPRLAFNVLSENLVFLSMRDMLANFMSLVFMASWCFIGFLLTLKWLNNGIHTPATIGKFMIWIWFGLDGTGIQESPSFHHILGPAVMIMFAFLGNTLFVTILVSVLSNTFSNISANAVQEMQYRRAVLTFEGVKADAMFLYMPPLNLFALFFILPLKFLLSARWFHKVNVFTVKVVNAPLLFLISYHERRYLWLSSRYKRMRPKDVDWKHSNGPAALVTSMSRRFRYWDLSRFSAHSDMQAVFDEVPLETAEDMGIDGGIGQMLKEGFMKQFDAKKRSQPCSPVKPRKGFAVSTAPSSSGNTLSRVFAGDSTSSDGDDEGAPTGYQKLRRGTRKDSIIDFHETNPDMLEANARLQKLEDSVQKIEALLMQLISASEAPDEDDREARSNDDKGE